MGHCSLDESQPSTLKPIEIKLWSFDIEQYNSKSCGPISTKCLGGVGLGIIE